MRSAPYLPGFRKGEVPRFPGWAATLGPGIVWMALAQGSGELIWWPYLIAKYGLAFLFLLLPACVLQWPLTFEIGRYTLLTGESIWVGFLRMSRLFALPLWCLMLASFLWFGAYASAGGTAMAELTNFPAQLSREGQSLFWGYATIAVLGGAVAASRVVYRFIERFMIVVAVVTVVGLVVACAHSSVLDKLSEFSTAIVVPHWPPARAFDPSDTSKVLTAITFAGLGGFWALFYSYWIREKGAGMAKHTAKIPGLRGNEASEEIGGTGESEATQHGFPEVNPGTIPSNADESAPRIRRWLRFLAVDSGIGVFGNLFTTLLACLLAYAVLMPQGLIPQGWELASVQSEFFAVRWGLAGKALFLIVAAAFLGDTWLSTADAVARVNTDVVRTVFPRARTKSVQRWYFTFFVILTVVTCATMPLAHPGSLIVISAVLGFCGTVAFSIGVWVLNHRYLKRQLPDFARPTSTSGLLIAISCTAYLCLAIAYIWTLLS